MEFRIRLNGFYRNSYIEKTLIANNKVFIAHMIRPAKSCSRNIDF